MTITHCITCVKALSISLRSSNNQIFRWNSGTPARPGANAPAAENKHFCQNLKLPQNII